MTLGSFTGYFRKRSSISSTTFPYGDYAGHYVVGVIYTRKSSEADEFRTWSISELKQMPGIVQDLLFFAQPKYKIAKASPGSGNTKNIGAVNNIDQLLNGTGPFALLGEVIFDDFWMNYMTNQMSQLVDREAPPYRTLEEYKFFKNLK